MLDRDLLTQILTATKANSFVYTSVLAHQPMLANQPPLVEVNTSMPDPTDGTKFATRATQAAEAYLASPAPTATVAASDAPKYALVTGAVLPEAKRRGNPSGNGAPAKYPFASLEVGGMFFSANSEHKNKDAVKALGSTVSMHNDKYSKQVMENGVGKTKEVTRAVRDKTTKKAAIGPDGKKVTETVQLPVKEYERKFTIRPVVGGTKYGEWEAPADGALIARIK